MHQAREVLDLVERLKRSDPNFSIGMFTGYDLEELERGDYETFEPASCQERQKLWQDIRSRIDFAIFGRYDARRRVRGWSLVSSDNQKLILFTDRHTWQEFDRLAKETVEMIIDPSRIVVTGFPL